MIVVLEMAIAAPAKTLSSTVQPKARPTRNPSQVISPDCTTAVTPAVGADADELPEAELEAEREHQEDHAELGERLRPIATIGDERDGHVRTDDQAGDDVAEHDRLAQALEDDRRHRRDRRARPSAIAGTRARRACERS